MKRITFKPEFKDKILAGEKTMTMRWKSQNWHEGEVRAAVTGQNGKPAFLTPVKDAFCHVKCPKATLTTFGRVTEEMAQRCGVTRDWYLKEMPGASEFTPIYIYEFEVVDLLAKKRYDCPHCDDGKNYRDADTLDLIEGRDNGHGMVESTCTTCGGNGWTEYDWSQDEVKE